MAQHKWHKEIKAWADGEEIEVKNSVDINEWIPCKQPNWSEGLWEERDCIEYRIKPQPKEPQYLYVYKVNPKVIELYDELQMAWDGKMLLGKIKLEQDDE